jgi:heptosyltransferase-2/heptosyltransferase-3
MTLPSNTPKKILLLQLRQLGDILLTTSCIRELKARYPEAHIAFLSHRMGEPLLKNNPYLDELITYHHQDTIPQQFARFRYLREQHYDLVIDFMNNPRSAIFSWITAAPQRLSFRQRLFGAYTHLAPLTHDDRYIVQSKFTLLRQVDCAPQNQQLIFPWQESDLGPYHKFVAIEPIFRDAPLRVLFAPSHRRAHRQWPLERYVRLADRLVREWHATVTWIWGPGPEEQEIDRLIAQCKEKTLKAPATTLPQLAAFMAQHDLFVGNSNGPSHIAVAVDLCSLQLHGHTNARAWCPQNERHQSLQSSEYGKVAHPSLEPISEDEVWKKLCGMKATISKKDR